MTERTKLNHEGQLALESSFIKVPFEQVKRSNRLTMRILDKEMTSLSSSLEQLPRGSAENAAKALDNSIERLGRLKRKLSDNWSDQETYCLRTKLRLEHLMELSDVKMADSEKFKEWSRVRLDRLLVDYMVRSGHLNTATKLAHDGGISHLVDLELFLQAGNIEDGLRSQNCSECLHWCSENRSALRKTKSTLEFSLRLQEFIELVRRGQKKEAIAYARKYFPAHGEACMNDIQQVMGLLAFAPDTATEPYRSLYDPGRWDDLIKQFRQDNYALNCLTRQPLLILTLQAGLAALKTESCYQDHNQNTNCPVCLTETYKKLATTLPKGHHVNSLFVCRISGEVMNEDNPPLVFPNGNVYSKKACEEMARKNNGAVTCLRTGEVYQYDQLKRVFLT